VVTKWKVSHKKSQKVKPFLTYIADEYLKKRSGWYEGHAPAYPSTNNGLESNDNQIKKRKKVASKSFTRRIFPLCLQNFSLVSSKLSEIGHPVEIPTQEIIKRLSQHPPFQTNFIRLLMLSQNLAEKEFVEGELTKMKFSISSLQKNRSNWPNENLKRLARIAQSLINVNAGRNVWVRFFFSFCYYNLLIHASVCNYAELCCYQL